MFVIFSYEERSSTASKLTVSFLIWNPKENEFFTIANRDKICVHVNTSLVSGKRKLLDLAR